MKFLNRNTTNLEPKNPINYILICWIFGIIIAPHFPFSQYLTLSIFTFIFFVFIYIKKSKYFFLLGLILFISLGFSWYKLYHKTPKNHYSNVAKTENQFIKFELIQKLNFTDYYRNYIIKINSISNENNWKNTSGYALLKVNQNKKVNLSFSEKYIMFSSFKEIDSPKNPHQFDYKKYLENKNISYQLKIDTILFTEKKSYSLKSFLADCRENLSTKIQNSPYSEDSKSIISALTLGDRTLMDSSLKEEFSKSGIIHLLAISGMHIGIIYLIFSWFYGLIFGKITSKKVLLILVLLSIWIFGIFVGLSASVFRACLMLSIYQIGLILKRPQKLLHVLGLSAFLILLYNPNQLFDVGFQLSFCAVLFIGLLNPHFDYFLHRKANFIPKFIRSVFSMTLSAQLGTLPIVLYYFHQFSLLSLFVNVLILPLALGLVVFSFISLIQITFLPNFNFIHSIFDYIIFLLRKVTNFASHQDSFLFQNISITLFQVCIAFGIILCIPNLFNRKKSLGYLLYIVFLFLVFSISILYNFNLTKNKKEFIIFHQPFNSVYGFRNASCFNYLIDENTNTENTIQYIINPYITGENISSTKQLQNAVATLFNCSDLVIFKPKKYTNQLPSNCNILWISHSTKVNSDILNSMQLKYIIVDGSNYPNYVKKIKLQVSDSTKLWITGEKGAFIYQFKQ
ncbi:MAG: ComEC family competence protein [Flavobacteriales bacterium]|nr:ComEC family competence protein [Flavobacteriales bacterium]